MAENGVSQEALAKMIGVSKSTFNRKINGRQPFNTDEIHRICAALDIQDEAEKAKIFLL